MSKAFNTRNILTDLDKDPSEIKISQNQDSSDQKSKAYFDKSQIKEKTPEDTVLEKSLENFEAGTDGVVQMEGKQFFEPEFVQEDDNRFPLLNSSPISFHQVYQRLKIVHREELEAIERSLEQREIPRTGGRKMTVDFFSQFEDPVVQKLCYLLALLVIFEFLKFCFGVMFKLN